MTKKKPPSRRSKNRWAALDPKFNLKSRQELIDFDYVDKLNDKEKDWLARFSEEYINASFDKNPRKNIQKSKKSRKEAYDRNNARNRDILTRAKASGKAYSLEETITSEEQLDSKLKELLESGYGGNKD